MKGVGPLKSVSAVCPFCPFDLRRDWESLGPLDPKGGEVKQIIKQRVLSLPLQPVGASLKEGTEFGGNNRGSISCSKGLPEYCRPSLYPPSVWFHSSAAPSADDYERLQLAPPPPLWSNHHGRVATNRLDYAFQ